MKRNATGSLTDLYRHDLIHYGEVLVPMSKKYSDANAKIGENGVIWYDGMAYSSPSPAGSAVTGKNCNGWDFWHVFRDSQTGEYRSTNGIERYAVIHGLKSDGWVLKELKVDISNVEMVSLNELRNKLPQGFAPAIT